MQKMCIRNYTILLYNLQKNRMYNLYFAYDCGSVINSKKCVTLPSELMSNSAPNKLSVRGNILKMSIGCIFASMVNPRISLALTDRLISHLLEYFAKGACGKDRRSPAVSYLFELLGQEEGLRSGSGSSCAEKLKSFATRIAHFVANLPDEQQNLPIVGETVAYICDYVTRTCKDADLEILVALSPLKQFAEFQFADEKAHNIARKFSKIGALETDKIDSEIVATMKELTGELKSKQMTHWTPKLQYLIALFGIKNRNKSEIRSEIRKGLSTLIKTVMSKEPPLVMQLFPIFASSFIESGRLCIYPCPGFQICSSVR